MIDFHHIGVALITVASILSLLFVIAKPLGREFEAVALVWIRAFKRIHAEWRKPLTIRSNDQQPQLINESRSKRELGPGSPQ